MPPAVSRAHQGVSAVLPAVSAHRPVQQAQQVRLHARRCPVRLQQEAILQPEAPLPQGAQLQSAVQFRPAEVLLPPFHAAVRPPEAAVPCPGAALP